MLCACCAYDSCMTPRTMASRLLEAPARQPPRIRAGPASDRGQCRGHDLIGPAPRHRRGRGRAGRQREGGGLLRHHPGVLGRSDRPDPAHPQKPKRNQPSAPRPASARCAHPRSTFRKVRPSTPLPLSSSKPSARSRRLRLVAVIRGAPGPRLAPEPGKGQPEKRAQGHPEGRAVIQRRGEDRGDQQRHRKGQDPRLVRLGRRARTEDSSARSARTCGSSRGDSSAAASPARKDKTILSPPGLRVSAGPT